MNDIEKLEIKISEVRQILYKLIDRKDNLLDKEVIIISKELDDLLNEYNKLMEKKNEI